MATVQAVLKYGSINASAYPPAADPSSVAVGTHDDQHDRRAVAVKAFDRVSL